MGSETKPCIHNRAPHQCDECRFFGTRYPTPAADGDADGLVSRAIGNIARNYVPENNSGISCGVTPAILSLADRVALVEAGAALRAENARLAASAECVKRVPELEAEVERLRARFKRYADHDEGCKSYDRRPCNCGFPEAWYATFPEDAAATREGT